jgi:glutamyl/glutaminyl-tRNA synthetase
MTVTWDERRRIKDEHRKNCFAKALAIGGDSYDKLAPFVEKLLLELCVIPEWNEHRIENCVRAFLDDCGIALKEFAPFIRAALTGSTESPPIFIVMEVLGLAETADRLRDPCRIAKNQLRMSGA